LAQLRGLQKIYTPSIFVLLDQTQHEAPSTPVEVVKLHLPSQLTATMRASPEMQQWIKLEKELRLGQLRTALNGVRTQLFVQTRLHTQRSLHVRGQVSSTRAQEVLDRQKRRLVSHRKKYQAAWEALKTLSGGELYMGFRQLHDSDCIPLHDSDGRAAIPQKRRHDGREVASNALLRPGASRKTLSWIWTNVDTSDDSAAMREATRVEWAKAWARKRRWSEELALIDEEMRRTKESLRYEAAQWRGRLQSDTRLESAGINAYANRQASIREALLQKFEALWALPDAPSKTLPIPRATLSTISEVAEEGEQD
jgi:hypothetical protein